MQNSERPPDIAHRAAQAISVHHLFKSYGEVKAVRDVNFSVGTATCSAFLGPNGAGKTTVMKILYGKADRDERDDTSIEVFGFDPKRDALSIKALSGVVPQEDSLDVELDVEQNLKIFAHFYGLRGKTASRKIGELLEFMELRDRRRARVRELSGGMKRRLVICRALLNDPRLLILDEPTTGLDPQVRQLIWDKVRSLKRQGVTILLTTHYMDEAFQLADEILIMDRGRKILEGTPDALLSREIESHVLELLEITRRSEVEKFAGTAPIRMDASADRVLYYSNEISVLKRMSEPLHAREYRLRDTNLEDLFLKSTGRSLNEIQ